MRHMRETTKQDLETILKIVERAERMDIGVGDRMTRYLDIRFAHDEFDLRLDEFLAADDFDFIHDFCGIQRHIDRNTCKMGGCFVPRFAGYHD